MRGSGKGRVFDTTTAAASRSPLTDAAAAPPARCPVVGVDRFTRTLSLPEQLPAMLQNLIIIAFVVVIIYNLGAGLYYMLTDTSDSRRTVKALTRRVGLSVVLILLVVLAIGTGILEPHGVQR
jgi:hypothetical protein